MNELYGVAPVLEALRAGRRTIETVTIADGVGHHRINELVTLARKKGIPVRQAPRAALDRQTSNANHQGVIARVSAARYAEGEALLEQISSSSDSSNPALIMVLDGVVDPRNFGAILRTAECAGVHGVFIPERRAVGLTETVAKAAAGALEHLPVARVGNLSRLIDEFKERNIWTVGTSAEASMEYTAWDWTTPTAVFMGGEGAGLHRLVRERCDALVSIPILGHIESLNVSVAAGIVLYEALRQRAAGGRRQEAAGRSRMAGKEGSG
ncbi:MAG: rRNA (guanosine2251-2-O)-methyltransferase [Blastocatellia bacterium]|nr:rRNA (guanosine2251-2-O)-methyltransferase [Blastocatellia bacterium]